MNTGRSGGAGGVATTPILGVTEPVAVVVDVGFTVAPVGGAKYGFLLQTFID